MSDATDAVDPARASLAAIGRAHEQARLEALTQTTVRLRFLRRRLLRAGDPESRARRQAVDNELLTRGAHGWIGS